MNYSRRLIAEDGHYHVQHSEKQLKIPYVLSNALARVTVSYQQCSGENSYLNIPKGQSSIKGMWREIKHVAYHSLREPMSPALDEGSVILVSSVAHLRDGNRAFKVWNEHSSSVLPSRWGKGIKQKKMMMAFSVDCTLTVTVNTRGRNIWWHLLIFQQLHCLLDKNNITFFFFFYI